MDKVIDEVLKLKVKPRYVFECYGGTNIKLLNILYESNCYKCIYAGLHNSFSFPCQTCSGVLYSDKIYEPDQFYNKAIDDVIYRLKELLSKEGYESEI